MLRATALFAVIAIALTAQESRPLDSRPEKFPLRILYAGRSDDPEHTSAWVDFLSQWFEKVGTATYSDFQPKDADPYDVVVFDTRPRPTATSIGVPKRPVLPPDFNRASLLVGGAGALIGEVVNSKFDWL